MSRTFWRWIVPMPGTAQKSWRSTLRWYAVRCLVAYGCLLLMLVAFQRSLMYHPTREQRVVAADSGMPRGNLWDVEFKTDAGVQRGFHMLPSAVTAGTDDERVRLLREARKVVLYFPGNAGNRRYRTDEMRLLAECGAHVFLFDYRGYAENPGSPTESGLHADARAAWDLLTTNFGVAPDRIVLFGESLGGGVAVPLAASLCREGTPPAGLVLRATFNSMTEAAAYHFPWLPVRWVLVDRYRSDLAIGEVTCPLLQLHGQLDTIVPLKLGRQLFDTAPASSQSGVPKQFVEIPEADHNDILHVARPQFQQAIRRFLEEI